MANSSVDTLKAKTGPSVGKDMITKAKKHSTRSKNCFGLRMFHSYILNFVIYYLICEIALKTKSSYMHHIHSSDGRRGCIVTAFTGSLENPSQGGTAQIGPIAPINSVIRVVYPHSLVTRQCGYVELTLAFSVAAPLTLKS